MNRPEASEIVRDFLMDKRKMDHEVYEAIKILYLEASAITDREKRVA